MIKTGICIYVCICGVCVGGFNKAKSISKQCVCITRYQAVLISRNHITEKYVVLPHRDLHCALVSLQGDAQRTEHMTWYLLREKYRNPQRPFKHKKNSNIDAEYIAFQERRRQAMLSMSTVTLGCDAAEAQSVHDKLIALPCSTTQDR